MNLLGVVPHIAPHHMWCRPHSGTTLAGRFMHESFSAWCWTLAGTTCGAVPGPAPHVSKDSCMNLFGLGAGLRHHMWCRPRSGAKRLGRSIHESFGLGAGPCPAPHVVPALGRHMLESFGRGAGSVQAPIVVPSPVRHHMWCR